VTREDQVRDALEVAHHHLCYLLDHPEALAAIPDGAVLSIVDMLEDLVDAGEARAVIGRRAEEGTVPWGQIRDGQR
jgi:hypothetical protein